MALTGQRFGKHYRNHIFYDLRLVFDLEDGIGHWGTSIKLLKR